MMPGGYRSWLAKWFGGFSALSPIVMIRATCVSLRNPYGSSESMLSPCGASESLIMSYAASESMTCTDAYSETLLSPYGASEVMLSGGVSAGQCVS